jgi:hypothetical protein
LRELAVERYSERGMRTDAPSSRRLMLARAARFATTLGLLVAALSLAGCFAVMLADPEMSDEERQQLAIETAPYLEKGTGSISGVVRIETSAGTFVGASGTQVMLSPATKNTTARFEKYVVGKNELPKHREAEYIVFTRTSAAGEFRFEKLPPGAYLLASAVRWSPTGHSEDARFEVPYARVTLGDGEQATVVVTRAIAED